MSPVLSLPVQSLVPRRRRAVTPSAFLFSESPEAVISPEPPAGVLAPEAGQSGSAAVRATMDGPRESPVPDRAMGCQRGTDRGANAPLIGIARLAAFSAPAETRRKSQQKPEYFLLPVKSILNRCDSDRVPFEWTINPYRGCEFACKYCYARYTHEYMELDGAEFEKKIYVKKDAASLLAWDVMRKYSYESEGSGGERPDHIAIGTATDPYQPAEREYGVTRSCLEELAKHEGLSVSIITKSNQIVHDIDVLQRIAEKSNLGIDITITTLRAGLTRLLEPRAPRPDLRLAAVKQLRAAGLPVGVSASPLIPGITDREGDLEAVAEAAKEAGAQWFFSGVLFLMPSSAKQFLPFVREKFPRLAKRYEEWFTKNGYAPEEYRKKASQRVAKIREKYGFSSRPWIEGKGKLARAQMSLAWDAGPNGAGIRA